ncbi:hypothetical protein MG293_006861 [Ovis ammon polii]|uniref:Uncharacterized protein n=1 Tax=Ovis ammon polii TaxID=230172 RepID=A0AAD4UFP4_OVIAM|nr:hypothetical protein MG293_006861 [Ovis ammon polii]
MRIHPENAELFQLCLRWCIGIANVSSEIKPVPLPSSPAFLYLGSFVSELDQASLSFQIPVSSVKTFTGYVLDSSGVLHDLVDGALNWKSRVHGLWKIFAADTETDIGSKARYVTSCYFWTVISFRCVEKNMFSICFF